MGKLAFIRQGRRVHFAASRLGSAICLSIACVLAGSAVAADGFSGLGPYGKETLKTGLSMNRVISYPGKRLLLLGESQEGTNAMVRLRRNGKIDGSFGNFGRVQIETADAVVDRRGNILVIASTWPQPSVGPTWEPSTDLSVVRLRPNGQIDRSFGTKGLARIDLGRRLDHGTAVALAPRGKILIGGGSATSEGSRSGNDAVAVAGRLLADGTLDRTFSGDGLKRLAAGQVDGLASGPGGSVLAWTDGGRRLIRLRHGGAFDTSFGDGGQVSVLNEFTFPGPDVEHFGPVSSPGVLPDGKVLVAGTGLSSDGSGRYSAMVLRYRADGRLDRSYGSGGATLVRAQNAYAAVAKLAVRRNGGAVLAVDFSTPSEAGSDFGFGAIALDSDGRLDRGFGRGGKVRMDSRGDDQALDLTLQRPGELVLLGRSLTMDRPFRNPPAVLARLPLRRR